MDISIVVATKNRPQALKECLESIGRQSVKPMEVIVVDAGVNALTGSFCESWVSQIPVSLKYIYSQAGLAAQRNAGARKAKGKIIGFVDDDVFLDARCLENVRVLFLPDDALGGVGATDEALSIAPFFKKIFWKIFMLPRFDSYGRMQRSGYPVLCNAPPTDRQVDSLSGVAAFFKADVFERFSFDERIPLSGGMEDTDFSFRVGKSYKLIQSRRARVQHRHSKEFRYSLHDQSYMMIYYHYHFFNKNMQACFLNKTAFLWSQLGEALRIACWAFKARSLRPLYGALRAHIDILKMQLVPK